MPLWKVKSESPSDPMAISRALNNTVCGLMTGYLFLFPSQRRFLGIGVTPVEMLCHRTLELGNGSRSVGVCCWCNGNRKREISFYVMLFSSIISFMMMM